MEKVESNKAIVLLSSGLDSTVNLYETLEKGWSIERVLTFNYGQRSAEKEILASAVITEQLNLKHQVVDLKFFSNLGQSALTNSSLHIPQMKVMDLDNAERTRDTAKAVWVPNRNGVFLNIAASFAEAVGAKWIIPGFNLEEAQTFPDNSAEFINKINESLKFSTSNHVEVKCFTIGLNKTQIVERALGLRVPFHLLWFCYLDQDQWCGQCESCQRNKRAFAEAGLPPFPQFGEII